VDRNSTVTYEYDYDNAVMDNIANVYLCKYKNMDTNIDMDRNRNRNVNSDVFRNKDADSNAGNEHVHWHASTHSVTNMHVDKDRHANVFNDCNAEFDANSNKHKHTATNNVFYNNRQSAISNQRHSYNSQSI
jgi:hypothetical protein